MRIGILILLCALVCSCFDTSPNVSTLEDEICTVDNPGCPSAWKIRTANDLSMEANQNGITITATPVASCNAYSCWATASIGGYSFVRADCFDFVTVEWCGFQKCDCEDTDESIDCCIVCECHDLPPLST